VHKKHTPEFEALQAKWYEKLKKSGFEEIERPDGTLNEWHSFQFGRNYNSHVFEANQEYSIMAGQFYHSHKFSSPLEKRVWKLHTAGLTIRDVAKKAKVSPSTAWRIVESLSSEMLKNVYNR
jgi:hypothetical protein